MKREIKFRTWDSHCKYFINFDFSQPHFDDGANQLTFDCDKVMGDYGGAERFIFQQFTGLKDKNGKEIYEGDIISNNAGAPRMEVIFNQGCFTLEGLEPIVGYVDGIGQIDQTNFLEVIGNIYENQTLLK